MNIALFVSDRTLSDEVLKKLVKFRKKINIVLVVSEISFIKKLYKKNFKNFKWVDNKKKNVSKIIEIIKKFKNKNLYGFSLQYNFKINEKILQNFKSIVNFHYGDLPKYCGHDTIIHGILKKEKFLYGTIHFINLKLDDGYIFSKIKIKNNNRYTSKDIEKILANKFANSFEKLIFKLLNKKKLILKKINNKGRKFFSINEIQKLKEVKAYDDILTKARAFDYPPHLPAFLRIKNVKIYLKLKPY